jgi:hypothetical protein
LWALFALLLMAVPMLTVWRRLQQYPVETPFSLLLLCLVPGPLSFTLPAALLLAVPLALRRQEPSTRLARRTIALSICCVAAMFVLMVWLVPEGPSLSEFSRAAARPAERTLRNRICGLAGADRRLNRPGRQVFARRLHLPDSAGGGVRPAADSACGALHTASPQDGAARG